jgi:phospholipid/cholesterol/gamma-HCH transport system substrate-binding protein
VNNARDALVGLVIIAAVILGFGGSLWLQGYTWGEERKELEAVFTEVGQIRGGAPVKVRGVRVGRVEQIKVDHANQLVRLRLRVSAEVVLPEDPVVIISPESMFGDWQAEIHSRGRFSHATYPDVEENGVLPGYALPDITQLTAEAAQIAENMAVLTDRVGIAFSEETARNIAALIDNVEDVSQGLSDLVAQQGVSFSRLTEEFREAAEGVTEAGRQAQRTLLTAQQSFETVEGLLKRDEVETLLVNMAELSESLVALSNDLQGTNLEAKEVMARIDTTFERVSGLVRMVEEGEGSLGRLLGDSTAAFGLEGSLVELQLLLEDIRENPRRYMRLSIF